MKLNYKRTFFVGLAFFLIQAFWSAYDNTIPLILTNKFGLSQASSGVVMALDNILALFMLPLFGAISDKCRHRLGKRTPFILVGTIIAALAFVGLTFADNLQLKNIEKVSAIDDPAALTELYTTQKDTKLQTPDGNKFVLAETFTQEEFVTIPAELVIEDGALHAYVRQADGSYAAEEAAYSLTGKLTEAEEKAAMSHDAGKAFTNPQYTNYVVPARQAYAHSVTQRNHTPLILFIVLLFVVLISMSTFRSPAVALMPDVTIKPLRSKANAIINLMGAASVVLVLGLGILFKTSSVRNSLMSYSGYFGAIAGVMLLALVIFKLTVNEPKLTAEMEAESKRYGIDEEPEEEQSSRRKLNRPELRSLIFLLASIVLWFMGYNAITSKYSVYASNVLHKDYNLTLMLANIAAIISFLPVGIISSKIGRKKTILAGIVMLTTAFLVACFIKEHTPTILMNAMFALAGIGWATISVNSFPMVVELCKGGDVGKYTGIYYTASMAAQTVTPMFSGLLMDKLGMGALFPYGTLFVALAFVTMLFVKHGDNKPIAKKGLEALDVED